MSRTAIEDVAYEMAIIDKNPTMVIFMLKAADPQQYRERSEKVDWNGDLSKLKSDQIDTILKQLRAELGYPDDYMPPTTQ